MSKTPNARLVAALEELAHRARKWSDANRNLDKPTREAAQRRFKKASEMLERAAWQYDSACRAVAAASGRGEGERDA